MLDATTPRAVFREYEARKARLSPTLSPADYERAVMAIGDELGIGLAPDELTEAQRERQARAVAQWGSSCAP